MRTEGPPPDQVDGAQAAETAVTRTFLIADVRGYTSFTHSHGDEAAGHLAARFAGLARAAVTATGGEVIELRGDEALCVFHSARQALRAAVELQMRFRQHVEDQPAFPLGVGIGLAAGEARSEERRVGKECATLCRSRWSPYHSKKKTTRRNGRTCTAASFRRTATT